MTVRHFTIQDAKEWYQYTYNPARNVLLLEAGEVFRPDYFPEMLADADRLGGATKANPAVLYRLHGKFVLRRPSQA